MTPDQLPDGISPSDLLGEKVSVMTTVGFAYTGAVLEAVDNESIVVSVKTGYTWTRYPIVIKTIKTLRPSYVPSKGSKSSE